MSEPISVLDKGYVLLRETQVELRNTQARLRDAERELAMLRAVLAQRSRSVVRLVSGAELDLEQRTVTRNGSTAQFTAGEWRLVKLLLSHQRPVDRMEIAEVGYQGACCASLIATMVSRIRSRLDAVGARGDLLTRGARYEILVTS